MTKDNNGEDDVYRDQLRLLQIEMVKLQRHLIASDQRVLVIFEGRDAAGKDGTIKRLTEHMAPRETRVYAPPKPSDLEMTQWYFQRFVAQLPAADQFVIFNRSWYNRVGVERVMGFCTKEQVKRFFHMVVPFECQLIEDGIELRKYYLDISRKEQKARLADRRSDPLTQWKLSPIDAVAQKKWKDYSKARDEMLKRTSHHAACWTIVKADSKKTARLNVMRHLLASFSYPNKSGKLLKVDDDIVFRWSPKLQDRLAK